MFLRALALLFAAAASALGQSVISNGSFEEPDLSFTRNIGGSFSIGSWSGFAVEDGGNAGLVVGTDGARSAEMACR